MEKLKKARIYAIINAYEHNYKADLNAVIGKLISTFPEMKKEIRLVIPKIKEIVEEVNSLTKDEINNNYYQLIKKYNLKKEKKQEKKLKELNNVKDHIIMRFEPSPSGPLHLGHAYTFGLNILYTRKYSGTLILRIGDTNPLNIYEKAYDLIKQDAEWLANKKINNYDFLYIIQSDRMSLYYSYAKRMIEKGIAYVCSCKQEHFQRYKKEKKECPCRLLPIEAQLIRWEKMFSVYKPGEAVLRFKSAMDHKNPAMRDFPLMRILEIKHPKQKDKYRVWPLMNFSVFVDDAELGITHIIRAKDHMDNAKKQEMMYKALKLPLPETLFVGRINFKGFEVSCTKTREKIKQGFYDGWDDIRLPFLLALKRRGYKGETFIEYAKQVGISENDKTVTKEEFFKTIDSINRNFIEPVSYRFFFINNPLVIKIDGLPKEFIDKKITLDLHPDNKKFGRIFILKNNEFLIEKRDYQNIEDNMLIRFMDLFNLVKKEKKVIFHSKDYLVYKNYKHKKMIIHWIPNDISQYLDADVLMPDKTIRKGIIEHNVKNNLHLDDTAQLERFAFVRLDNIDNKGYHFWFTHK